MLEPFDCYSPGALRLYHFEHHGEEHLLAAEVRRTLDAIVAAEPGRIAKGQLTRDDADAQALLWHAIAEDLDAQAVRGTAEHRDEAPPLPNLTDAPACACGCLRQFKVAANGVRWEAKVRALRREIEARRTGYPAEVDKGRLTADQAKQRLDRLEAVHDLYWRHGFAFDGSRDELRALSTAVLDSHGFTPPSGDSSTVEQPTIRSEDGGATPPPRSTSAGASA